MSFVANVCGQNTQEFDCDNGFQEGEALSYLRCIAEGEKWSHPGSLGARICLEKCIILQVER